MSADTGFGIELPCGEQTTVGELDLGQREIDCTCGDRHAVVYDVNPPSRFLPPTVVETLEETIEPADEFETFETAHLMGQVIEAYPDQVTTYNAGADSSVGFGIVWITSFDAQTLHEIVVRQTLALMETAISDEQSTAYEQFQTAKEQFDVVEFTKQYRTQRDYEEPPDERPS